MIASAPARADNVYWKGGDGNWSAADGWQDDNGDPHAAPVNGDSVFLIAPGTVNYDIPGISLAATNVDWGATLRQNANTLVSDWEEVGNSSFGVHEQNGSAVNVINNDLNFGQNPTGSGYYYLSGGLLDVRRLEHLGVAGSGSFVQTGGVHQTAGYLLQATGSPAAQGSYVLSGAGSTLQVGTWEAVGFAGGGTFDHSGASQHIVGSNLYIGYEATADGAYTLRDAGSTLVVNGSEQVGRQGNGMFNQENGTHTVEGNLWIARSPGSTGVYNLIGGTLDVNGEIINQGTFNHDQGTNTVKGLFTVDSGAGGAGTYNFNNGTINANGGMSNSGTFNQSNGLLATSATGNVMNNNTYNFNGGGLNTNAGLTNNGTFNFGNGQLMMSNTTNLVNNNTFNVIGQGGTGSVLQNGWAGTGNAIQTGQAPVQPMAYANSSQPVSGAFINNGAWNVSNATVEYNLGIAGSQVSLDYEILSGPRFFNNGAYISDPSMSIFWNLINGDTGYLRGGAGDEFLILGDFENASTQTGLWDTKESLLGFVGDPGASHVYMLAGLSSLFDWDTLYLSSGNSLSVIGSFASGVQFNEIVLDDGLAQLGMITSGQNIYYNILRDRAGNLFDPANYSLNGGGSLIHGSKPVVVPEPASLVLFGAGLLALRRAKSGFFC